MFSLAGTLWHHTVFLLSVQTDKKLVPGHIWLRVTLTAELLNARVIIRSGKTTTKSCELDKQVGKVIKKRVSFLVLKFGYCYCPSIF